MQARVWICSLLVAAGSSVWGAEFPGAIWWAAESRGHLGGGRPGGAGQSPAAGMPAGHSGSRPGAPPAAPPVEADGGLQAPRPAGASRRDGSRRHSGEGPPAHVLERMRQGGYRPPHALPASGSAPAGPGGGHPASRPDAAGPPTAGGASPQAGGNPTPSRAELLAAMRKPKPLLLRWGDFPATQGQDSRLGRLVKFENLRAWIRVPDGSIVAAELTADKGTVVTKCPPEAKADAELPNGVYVVGMHLDAGVADIDADGELERVHFYSNGLTSRFTPEGQAGSAPDVFFKAPDKLALEIGPIATATGRGGFLATSQTALEENKLQVLFRGQPLAHAQVNVLSDSGWKNRLTADENGILTVVPVGKKSDGRVRMTPSDQSLYVVVHEVKTAGEHAGTAYAAEYHCASLLLGVRMPGPEWKSKSEGFQLATTSGLGFLVLAGIFGLYRRRRRAAEVMVQFDRHRIHRGDA